MTEIYLVNYSNEFKEELPQFEGQINSNYYDAINTHITVLNYLKKALKCLQIKESNLPIDKVIETSPHCIITRSHVTNDNLFFLEETLGPFCLVHKQKWFDDPFYLCTVDVSINLESLRMCVYKPVINSEFILYNII
jgi:hypothetical protein